jgi:CRP/FNR family transcriptional regulator
VRRAEPQTGGEDLKITATTGVADGQEDIKGAAFMALVADLSTEHAGAVGRVFRQRTFNAGAVILKEGEYQDFVYIVQSGKARITRSRDRGKDSTILMVGPGDFIGFDSLFTENADKTAIAIESLTVVYSPRDTLIHFMDTIPQFGINISKILSARIQALEERISSFSGGAMMRRLVPVLLKMAEAGEKVDESSVKVVGATHEFLASVVGASRESVTIALNKIKGQKAIKQEGKGVLVVKPKILQRISENE